MAPSLSTLKRPASTVLKRPAGKQFKKAAAEPTEKAPKVQPKVEEEEEDGEEDGEEEEEETNSPVAPKLSKKALKDHNRFCEEVKGMDAQSFGKALQSLDSGATQRLWKQFQSSRKAGGQEAKYQEALKGAEGQAGSLAKRRNLLHAWVQNDKTCGDKYKEFLQSISLTKENAVTSAWLTANQALNHWGKDELWARVQAGTIQARKNPQDRRYWEFKAVTHTGKTKVTNNRITSAGVKGKADKGWHQDFLTQDWDGAGEEDWMLEDPEDDPEEKAPAGIAQALGIKPDKNEKNEKTKKENDWEAASKISDTASQRSWTRS